MPQTRDRDALFPSSLLLGRVGGVPIGLHVSWLLIAGLITLSLATHFAATHPDWTGGAIWSAAGFTAVLFFLTLLAHELAHALVAKARGLPVRSITLFALGGIAHIAREANTAKTEFLVAVVGPITSFLIGFACIAVAASTGWTPDGGTGGAVGSVLGWLGWINVILAVFNLLPGYPLDGGRLLRSFLWWRSGDLERATRHAARAGQVIAVLFIAVGVLQFFSGLGLNGLWLAFIGWFLLSAAGATHAHASVARALEGVRVGDIMADDCAVVDAGVSVRTLVDELLLRTGRRCIMVQGAGRVLGLVTPTEVRRVDRDRWSDVTAREVMRPLESLETVTPDSSAGAAFTTMAREDLNQLPVIADGRVAGVVSRGQILRLLQSRTELRV